MKRRTSTAPMKIYSYGCRLPTSNAELVESQLILGHRYYNKLVEIERRRRQKVREAQSASSTIVAQCERAVGIYGEHIQEVMIRIAAKKSAARTQKVDQSEERQVLSILFALKRQASANLKMAKHETRTPGLLAVFAEISHVSSIEIAEARAANGLYWGTYVLIEKAVQAACESPTDPEFRRFESVPNRRGVPTLARGRIGVQLQKQARWMSAMLADRETMPPDVRAFVEARFVQKRPTEVVTAELGLKKEEARSLLARATAPYNGAPVGAIMGGNDERLQIDPPAKNGMSRVRVRIGTKPDGRSPIFAEFPFRLHRPLPADGVIKQAWISKTTKGRWVDWKLQISVEAESLRRSVRPPSDGGVVAFDIGWRLREADVADKMRVAYWHDDQGNHGELVLPNDDRIRVDSRGRRRRPESFRARLDHATSLRAIEDRNFDDIRAELLAWKKDRKLPAELETSLEWLHAWKAPRKLGSAFEQWETNRFEGDGEMFARVQAWWKQHRHLYDWESSERDRTLNARKNLYREWTADFTRRYAVVVIEEKFLAEVAKLQPVYSKRLDLPKPTRRNRTVAACSEFVLALKNAAARNGCTISEEPYEDTTAKCSACGHIERFDHRPLKHQCEKCGGESGPVDQDYNAARNLLAAYAGRSNRSQTPPKDSDITGIPEGTLSMPAQGAVP